MLMLMSVIVRNRLVVCIAVVGLVGGEVRVGECLQRLVGLGEHRHRHRCGHRFFSRVLMLSFTRVGDGGEGMQGLLRAIGPDYMRRCECRCGCRGIVEEAGERGRII